MSGCWTCVTLVMGNEASRCSFFFPLLICNTTSSQHNRVLQIPPLYLKIVTNMYPDGCIEAINILYKYSSDLGMIQTMYIQEMYMRLSFR